MDRTYVVVGNDFNLNNRAALDTYTRLGNLILREITESDTDIIADHPICNLTAFVAPRNVNIESEYLVRKPRTDISGMDIYEWTLQVPMTGCTVLIDGNKINVTW